MPKKKRDIRKELVEQTGDESLLFADGFDSCIVGVTEDNPMKVVYNAEKIVKTIMKKDKMKQDEAWEYFYFNIAGAYVGERTPIYVTTKYV